VKGIEGIVSRADLADRGIFVMLQPIREHRRRPETELWREFEIARPRILGAFLDAAVHGLRAIGRVHVDRLPRMADFALWATACETALWPAGTVARAYAANRRAAIESIIEVDPVAMCVRALGQKIPARSPAACVARSPSCGHWASILRSVVKAEQETESSGCVLLATIPSAPSAASATMDPGSGERPQRPAGDVCDNSCRPDWSPCPIEQVAVIAADGADGADAKRQAFFRVAGVKTILDRFALADGGRVNRCGLSSV
jgi:hypothetical protein